MKQRLIVVGAGLVVLLVITRIGLTRTSSGGEVAVDTTGASAQGGAPSTRNGIGTQTAVAATGRTPSIPLTNSRTPTPLVVQIQGTAVSIAAKPLVLLN